MFIQIRTPHQPQSCLILESLFVVKLPATDLGSLGIAEEVSQTSEHLTRVCRGQDRNITQHLSTIQQNKTKFCFASSIPHGSKCQETEF